MQKLYLEYPEIEEIKANIISRRVQDNNTQIILDRTIFMPKTSYLLEDKGSILDLEILSVDEKRDNIIHLVKGKPHKSEVVLKLDMENRLKNLSYNTAYIIFKIVMGVFYNFKDIKLQLSEERAVLKISEFYDKLDISLIEDQVNFIIAKALPIDNKQGITSIAPLGEVVNNNLCFDNTSRVRALKITNTESFGNDLEVEFLAADDILN
ncbi:hypothetical protein [uncultured Anaerococcus sp.]|uniref:hypothetical protein n=1 Tax=uncultured Anaerococcus sp. TaxID=293428 RepID=UPI0026205661|nr:hypothetical protein [uncultured Anaerococcus sp.]